MDKKSDLRIKAKTIRKELDIDKISSIIVEKIRNTELYKNALHIALFYPMKYEINLLKLFSEEKKFYLPKVDGENLIICPFGKDDSLVKSSFNVLEPCTAPVNPELLDLIFVPALMVDEKNFRLGYGGGFYDRFLAKYPQIPSVVPIVKELTVDNLPHEDFDRPVKFVISN